MIKKTLCFSNRAYLCCKNRQLVITVYDPVTGEPSEHTRPIEDIGVIVIESEQVTLSSYLISSLLENKVAVIVCDQKHMPFGLMLPLVGNTEQTERFNAQIEASLPLKKQLWQQTIAMKIRNQAAVLKRVNNMEVGNMIAWSSQVRSGDSDNLEGRAAAYYWKNLFEDNPGFIRRQEGIDPNGLLNYGYAILRAIIARSLVASGLIPTLGIHHSNKYNAYCLADDIMEPYRPYVDLMVVDMIKTHNLPPEITKETKKHLLTIPTIDVKMGKLSRPLMVAASMTTASLAKCYLGESRKLLYPEMDI
ncbi:MAG: type II CRISPR-associated endonuclease Cas1 [Lepagella sp.]